ncbi:unnamed protein product [Acanthosepion pharaonis]|uniref:Uncharacterized protein n=1 Tax=Acanthosepion pharaonis TaxID=158019 RepID=A0A812D483_ACAPH|nr:unnamed protein product [Sepia pharaonis]
MVSMIEEAKELEEKPEVESLPSTKEITIGEEQLISIIATEKTIDTEAMEAVVSIKKDSLSDEEFFEVPSTEVTETEFEEIKPEETKIAITATTKTLVAEDITPEFRDTVEKICEEAEVQPQSDEVLISEMEQIIIPSHMETILADSEETGKEISTITLESDLEIKPKVSDEIPKELSTISILTVASEDSDITAVEKVTDIIPTIEEEAKADEIITTEPLEITLSSSATSVTKEEVDKFTESTTLEVIPHEEMKPQSEELQITLTSAAVAPTEETIVAISEESKPEEKISVVAAEPQIPQVSEFVLPVVEQAKITSKITTSIKEGEAPVSDEKVKDVPSQITINIESKEISTEKQEPLIGKVEETFIYEDEEKESGDEVFDVPEESTEKVTLQQIQSGDLQISVKSEMVSMIEEAKELEEKPEVESLPSTKEITIGEEQLISIIATEKTIDTEAMEAVVSIKKDSLSDEEFFEVPSTEVKETEFEEIKPEETKIAITATIKTLVAEDITPEFKDTVKKVCEEAEVQPQSDEVLISEMEQIITPSHKETILADSEETGKEISTITLKSDLEIKPKVSDEIPKELSTISILTVASEDSDITPVEKVTDIIPTIEEEAKSDEISTTEPLEIAVSSSATSVTKEEVDKLTESTTLDVIQHEKMKPQSEELQITLTSAAVAPTEKTIVAISEETKPEEKISVVAAEPQIPQVSEFVLPVVEQAKITSKITTSIKEGEAPVSDEKVKDVPSQITINIESKEISTEKQEPLIGKVEETFIYEDEEKESGDEVFDVPEESTEKVTLQQIQSGDLQISVKSEMVSMIEEAKELEEKPEVESLPSTKEITIGEEQLISIIATEKTIDTEAMEAVVSIKKDSLSDEEFFEVLSTEVKETEFEEIKPEETKIAITATTKTLLAEDITPEFRDTVEKICEEAEVQPQSDEVLISEMEQIITPSHKETILADSEETGKEISTITLKSDLEIKPKVSDEIPKELSTISILTVASEDSDITPVEKVTDIIPTIEEEAKSDEISTTEPLEIAVSSSATSVTKEEVDKFTESTTLEVIPHEEMKPQSEELQITLTSAAVAPTEKTIVAISEETKPEEKISVVAAEPQIPQVSEFVLPVVEQAKITSKITTSIRR